MTDAMVLTSGGLDSAACAHFLKDQGSRVRCLFIDYGQAAAIPERKAATAVASSLRVPISIRELVGGSRFPPGELRARNAFLITAALFLGQLSSGLLAIGIHAGTPYYDCSAGFVDLMTRLTTEHTDGAVRLVVPFLNWRKREVFDYFVGAGLQADLTYSCEAGTEPACGKCASCLDRRALGC